MRDDDIDDPAKTMPILPTTFLLEPKVIDPDPTNHLLVNAIKIQTELLLVIEQRDKLVKRMRLEISELKEELRIRTEDIDVQRIQRTSIVRSLRNEVGLLERQRQCMITEKALLEEQRNQAERLAEQLYARKDDLLCNSVVISTRACCVCGRDDLAGTQQHEGFKCYKCTNLPKNPRFEQRCSNSWIKRGKDPNDMFVLNNYTLVRTLEKSTFGTVQLAIHNISNQGYTIKSFRSTKFPFWKEFISRTRLEVGTLTSISHANLCKIYGTIESGEGFMLVSEYLLPLPEEVPHRVLKKYTVAIAKGLQHLHYCNLLHRSLKPCNLLVDRNDNVKLTGYSYGRLPSDQCVGYFGSPAYFPPEAFANEIAGEETDMWQFGVTLHILLTSCHIIPHSSGLSLRRRISDEQLEEIGLGFSNVQNFYKNLIYCKPTLDKRNNEIGGFINILIGLLDPCPTTRSGVQDVLDDPFLSEVCTLGGIPVEFNEIQLQYNSGSSNILIKSDPTDTLKKFLQDAASCSLRIVRSIVDNSITIFDTTVVTQSSCCAGPDALSTSIASNTRKWSKFGIREAEWTLDDVDAELS